MTFRCVAGLDHGPYFDSLSCLFSKMSLDNSVQILSSDDDEEEDWDEIPMLPMTDPGGSSNGGVGGAFEITVQASSTSANAKSAKKEAIAKCVQSQRW